MSCMARGVYSRAMSSRDAALEIRTLAQDPVPIRVRVHVEREHVGAGTYPIEFRIKAEDHPHESVREHSVFIVR